MKFFNFVEYLLLTQWFFLIFRISALHESRNHIHKLKIHGHFSFAVRFFDFTFTYLLLHLQLSLSNLSLHF